MPPHPCTRVRLHALSPTNVMLIHSIQETEHVHFTGIERCSLSIKLPQIHSYAFLGAQYRQNPLRSPMSERGELRSPMSERGELRLPMSERGELRLPMSERGELRSPMSERGQP
jgi:hypothetical protein